MKTRIKLPENYYNSLSYLGTGIAVISFVVFIVFATFAHLFTIDTTYAGIITYIIIPVFIIIGLLLIPTGMIIKRRRDKKIQEGTAKAFPIIDFNNKQHFNAFLIFVPATIILFIFTAFGTYKAYHYTESVEFCGTMCHKVMMPEYVTYQNSPHQRVACVECHIGSGADWYVKSKMSGLYQVYSVTFNKYERPIATPILKLRPARETCEECHWPEKYYPYTLRTEHHFLSDEKSSKWDIDLVLKTSAPVASEGISQGIHWHINPNVAIDYVGYDKRQYIPWVKYTNKETGEEITFSSTDTIDFNGDLKGGESRIMDCLDCHNRPSHNYNPPMRFLNMALSAGRISRDIPDIKMFSIDLLSNIETKNPDSIGIEINAKMEEYYSGMYEDFYAQNKELIQKTAGILEEEYKKNIFPEMNVRWDAYPNHIGHLDNIGCFRCHDNNHKSEDGRVISNDCNLCHSIISQSGPDTTMVSTVNKPLEFYHMTDPDQSWKEMACWECHMGMY